VAGIIGQIVVDIPGGLSLTPPQEIKKRNGVGVAMFIELALFYSSI
jgi:hypothetical protein